MYHFSQERITFEKAKSTCENNFGKLFEPKTEAINIEIAIEARKKGIINPWIGIHHIHHEDRTVFASDNTPVAWSNWDTNEPNNNDNREDCVHLYNDQPELKECDLYYIESLIANGICNDESNTEACKWDGGDCCGGDVVMTKCSACECLETFQWNDNTCEEFRKFICQKEDTGYYKLLLTTRAFNSIFRFK